MKIRPDRTLWRVLADGTEVPMPVPPARLMTDAEWAAAPRIPRAITLRRALHLTQEEFAARYHIPLGTLRDWEQGRSEPDQTARAYLRAIASDAEPVRRALEKRAAPLQPAGARGA